MNEQDITTETFRIYHYPDGSCYRIDNPVKLWWKRDENGDSYRVEST